MCSPYYLWGVRQNLEGIGEATTHGTKRLHTKEDNIMPIVNGQILEGTYFYVIGISFDKMHFTCIWVNLSRFKMIITNGYIEDMKITQELLKKSAICRSRYLLDRNSICQDSLKLDTCPDLSSLRDSDYSQQRFYSKMLFVYGFV